MEENFFLETVIFGGKVYRRSRPRIHRPYPKSNGVRSGETKQREYDVGSQSTVNIDTNDDDDQRLLVDEVSVTNEPRTSVNLNTER